MYPHERSLVKQLADKPFALIGVNSDSDLEKLRETVKEKNISWRSFQNEQEEGSISSTWGITGWPTIYVLDAEGKIRYKNVHGAKMDKALETLLAEMGEEVKIVHEDEEKDDKEDDKEDDDNKGDEESKDGEKKDGESTGGDG